jgi:hypothetical protein
MTEPSKKPAAGSPGFEEKMKQLSLYADSKLDKLFRTMLSDLFRATPEDPIQVTTKRCLVAAHALPLLWESQFMIDYLTKIKKAEQKTEQKTLTKTVSVDVCFLCIILAARVRVLTPDLSGLQLSGSVEDSTDADGDREGGDEDGDVPHELPKMAVSVRVCNAQQHTHRIVDNCFCRRARTAATGGAAQASLPSRCR